MAWPESVAQGQGLGDSGPESRRTMKDNERRSDLSGGRLEPREGPGAFPPGEPPPGADEPVGSLPLERASQPEKEPNDDERPTPAEARELAEIALEHSPDPVLWISPEGRILFANAAASALLGYPKDALLRKAIYELEPHLPPRKVSARWEQLQKLGSRSLEAELRTSDGTLVPVEVATYLVRHGGRELVVWRVRDLRPRAAAVHAARLGRVRARNLMDASPLGILIYQLEKDGRLVLVRANPAADRVLGVRVGDLVGLTIEQAFPGLAATEIPRRYKALAKHGGRWRWEELEYHHGDLQSSYEVVAFQTAPGEVVVMFHDLAPRKRAEEEQRRSEERLRLATHAARVGVWEFLPAEDRLEWDELMFRLYGLEPGRGVEGLADWLARIHPEDRDWAETTFMDPLRSGTHPFETEFRIVRGDDQKVRVMRCIGLVLRTDGGKPLRIIGVNQDVTEARQYLDALRASEERFRSVIEQSNEGIYILYEGRFDLVNRRFCEIVGLTPNQLREPDFSFWSLVAPESQALIRERAEARARGDSIASVYEFFIVTPRGNKRRVEASVTEIDYRGGKAVLGFLRDVTEQARLEEELRQALKMESLGRLAGGVAHDLNNLLSPILGFSELLLEDFSPDDPRREFAQEILGSAGRARDLVKQLLAFGRKQTLDFRSVDLNALVEELARLLRRTIREDIRLEVDLDPRIPSIRADAGQLQQVVMNLAVNAQEAMPGGGRLAIRTRREALDEAFCANHSGLRPGEHVLLEVADTGVGMDPAVAALIFEPFFTTKPQGTGLGLSTVYGILQQHSGAIWFESEPGKGTSFRCYFPAEAAATPSADEEASAPIAVLPQSSGTVLVVEDDEAVRTLVESVLRRQGYSVLSFSDARGALAYLDGHVGRLDLLLSDVILPGIDGSVLAREVRARYPETRILFMSGYTDDIITERGVLREGLHFLPKPFTVRQLVGKIQQILGT